MSVLHIALAVLVAAIWGINFAVVKIGVAEIPPLFLTALRFAFAALPAVLFVARPTGYWCHVIGFGIVLGVVKFGLLFTGMALGMPAGLSSVVLQMHVFFTVVLAIVFFKDYPGSGQVAAFGLAAAGLAVIVSHHGFEANPIPLGFVILAALAWAFANIITKRAGQIDMVSFIVWSSAVAPLP